MQEKIKDFNRLVELAVSEHRKGYGNLSYIPYEVKILLKGQTR